MEGKMGGGLCTRGNTMVVVLLAGGSFCLSLLRLEDGNS